MSNYYIKDGWKTSEFWISISTAICGLCVIFGVFNTDDLDKFLIAAEKIGGSIMTVVSVATYSLSRSKVKQNTFNINDLKNAAENAVLDLLNNEDEPECSDAEYFRQED